tara:strand:- start:57 stop:638 length:582 start_codon:yes stop_codon:yes gene_type:complete
MGNFPTNDGFMATALAYNPTNTIDPRPAWLFENQTGTLGTNLTGSAVYVGVAGTVRGILAGKEGVQGTVTVLGSILTGGTGYTTANGLATTVTSIVPSSAGTGCTVDITAVAGAVTVIAINAVGQQYSVGDILTVVQGGSNCTVRINSVQSLAPVAGDAIDFLNVPAGTILPVVFDYILIPGANAATNLIVGK